MKIPYLICLLSLVASLSLHASSLATANQAFLDKNYQEAVLGYESALAEQPSAVGHFNAGQAYRELAEAGFAAFHYSQALKIGGTRDTAALTELMNLYQDIGFKAPHSSTFYRVVYFITPQQWLLLATACGWIAGASFMWFGFARKRKLPGTIIVLSLLLLAPAIASLLYFHKQADQAIVLKESSVTVSPTTKAESLLQLPAASWITIHQETEDHYEISIGGQEQKGWITKEATRKIW